MHLGLGAFSRSHLAWYTARALDARDWGISAYTGRSRELAEVLTTQDGLYTLIERSAEGDRASIIENVVEAHVGGDLASLIADISADETVIISLTITEAGYRVGVDGLLDSTDSHVRADLAALSNIEAEPNPSAIAVSTAIGRLVLGLDARRRACSGPITVMSCDNLPNNGSLLREALLGMAEAIPDTAAWCKQMVSFASTSVDRITPSISPEEQEELAATYGDRAPVIAEPFSDWIIEGEFPAGRPAWESAGARFTDDLEPWESRKLWLLNGAHTLLASLGQLRGHRTVAEAITDPVCLHAVNSFWDEAERHLPATLGLTEYRSALHERFANARIEHQLSQIAIDTPTKLRLRVMPVAVRERESGREADACATVIASWLAAGEQRLVPLGIEAADTGTAFSWDHAVLAVESLSTKLAADGAFLSAVRDELDRVRHILSAAR
ncbi:mannitol dehydrogenase family protein [Arthrobacter sp. EH-1B-1]|uniref:Mannitol-1-phosphate 5-dehydrogenase n=1 Tax=Arthrobacter vasquezii TaxID=2977629 RepID=A0ABT6CUQ6_9MICC|nr:mannitol dehydrogenase family protein [Arthrobacter vasquezii]MDF9277625.1 mannitol dehydrogenase family protein [Arthrobacter vasquezii]